MDNYHGDLYTHIFMDVYNIVMITHVCVYIYEHCVFFQLLSCSLIEVLSQWHVLPALYGEEGLYTKK